MQSKQQHQTLRDGSEGSAASSSRQNDGLSSYRQAACLVTDFGCNVKLFHLDTESVALATQRPTGLLSKRAAEGQLHAGVFEMRCDCERVKVRRMRERGKVGHVRSTEGKRKETDWEEKVEQKKRFRKRRSNIISVVMTSQSQPYQALRDGFEGLAT
jgi:hypothetical protein